MYLVHNGLFSFSERRQDSVANTTDIYSDDNSTRQALENVDAKQTLHEIYGLFYGALAAPGEAHFSKYLPLIFDAGIAPDDVSEEDAEAVEDNLLSLWNFISRWKPDKDPFYFPEADYPDAKEGLLKHLVDTVSMVQYFITGLNLGGTEEADFSEDAIDAMHELETASTRLQKNITLCEALGPNERVDDPETTAMVDELEDIVADCISRVTLGLKKA